MKDETRWLESRNCYLEVTRLVLLLFDGHDKGSNTDMVESTITHGFERKQVRIVRPSSLQHNEFGGGDSPSRNYKLWIVIWEDEKWIPIVVVIRHTPWSQKLALMSLKQIRSCWEQLDPSKFSNGNILVVTGLDSRLSFFSAPKRTTIPCFYYKSFISFNLYLDTLSFNFTYCYFPW